jgi:hypothetical protein
MQRAMVVTQIAVSLILLVGALLFVRSFRNLMTVDAGLRQKGITVAFVGMPGEMPKERLEGFQRELLEEVQSIPGVRSAGSTTNVPLFGGSWTHGVKVGAAQGSSKFTWVSAQYFETMGIPLLAGRMFRSWRYRLLDASCDRQPNICEDVLRRHGTRWVRRSVLVRSPIIRRRSTRLWE